MAPLSLLPSTGYWGELRALCWALPQPRACSENHVSEPVTPLFILLLLLLNFLVIEIKFVLGVQLSLVDPSPVHSVENAGRPE